MVRGMNAYRLAVLSFVVSVLSLSAMAAVCVGSYLGLGPWHPVSFAHFVAVSGSPGFSAPA